MNIIFLPPAPPLESVSGPYLLSPPWSVLFLAVLHHLRDLSSWPGIEPTLNGESAES